jgi:hypothetical protein
MLSLLTHTSVRIVGEVAGFSTYKLDYANRCAANSATRTIATNGAQVRYVPKATTSSVAGVLNVDNRYQTVTVSSTTGILAGDAFTVTGIEAVHHITKRSTGQLKTFRVIEVVNGTSMVISPPIIAAATRHQLMLNFSIRTLSWHRRLRQLHA